MINGIGIREALGVGDRDLSETVGGRMAVDAMQLLAGNPETQLIILIAKSASPEAAAKLRAQDDASGKLVVICFIGSPEPDRTEGSIAYRSTLAGAAAAAPKAVSADSALPEELLQNLNSPQGIRRFKKKFLECIDFRRNFFRHIHTYVYDIITSVFN